MSNLIPNNTIGKSADGQVDCFTAASKNISTNNVEAALNQATKATQSTIAEYHFIIGKNFTVTGALD